MQTGRTEGMQTLDDCLTRLMQENQISIETGKALMAKSFQPGVGSPASTPNPSVSTGVKTGLPGVGQNPFKKTS